MKIFKILRALKKSLLSELLAGPKGKSLRFRVYWKVTKLRFFGRTASNLYEIQKLAYALMLKQRILPAFGETLLPHPVFII